jgi:hypothetical protein
MFLYKYNGDILKTEFPYLYVEGTDSLPIHCSEMFGSPPERRKGSILSVRWPKLQNKVGANLGVRIPANFGN